MVIPAYPSILSTSSAYRITAFVCVQVSIPRRSIAIVGWHEAVLLFTCERPDKGRQRLVCLHDHYKKPHFPCRAGVILEVAADLATFPLLLRTTMAANLQSAKAESGTPQGSPDEWSEEQIQDALEQLRVLHVKVRDFSSMLFSTIRF